MLRRLVRAVPLLLLTAGCRLGLDVGVELDRNGAGVLSVAVSADAELLERAADAGADPLTSLAETGAELEADGWAVQDSTDGSGNRTVQLRARFEDAGQFNTLAADLAAALAADEVILLEHLELTVTDDLLVLSGTAGAEPTRAVRDYGLAPARAVRLVRQADALDYGIDVSVPGEVVTSNATRVDGRRLRWEVPAGQTVDIALEATRPGLPVARAVLGALAGAVVAGAALWLVARRRKH